MVEGVGEGICGLSSALHGMGPISHNTRKRNIGERYSFWSGGREGEPFFSDSFVLFILGLQLAAWDVVLGGSWDLPLARVMGTT